MNHPLESDASRRRAKPTSETSTRVLFISDKLVTGGVERVLVGILRELSRPERPCDLDLTLLLPCPGGELEAEIPPEVSTRYVHRRDIRRTPIGRAWYYALQLLAPGWLNRRMIPRDEFDVVVVFKGSMIGRVRGVRARRICYVHNTFDDVGRVARLPIIRMMRTVETVVCVSQGIRRDFILNTGRTTDVRVLANPVDSARVRKMAEGQVRDVARRPRFLMVSVGRLEPIKRFDRLVEVARLLRDDGLDFEVWIIGEGSQRDALEQQIRRCGLGGRVRLLGPRKNPYPYVRMADLFVLTTSGEGYATVLTEALLLGTPIVSTDVVGTDEPLGQGQFGLLVGESPDEIRRAVDALMGDSRQLADLRERSRRGGRAANLTAAMQALCEVLNE